MDQLKLLYYDPLTGFISANKLYKKAKQLGLKLSHKQVAEFIQKQETAQLNRPTTTAQVSYNHIYAHKVNGCWQSDLLDMQKWSKFNNGYKWILNIVDVYSRYSFSIPLKTKSTINVALAIEPLLKKYKLENLTTDNGKEFIGSDMKNLLKKYNVKLYTHEPGSHKTLGIIERFNKTLRILLNKYFTATKTKNWIDVLDKFSKNYNSTVHNTIRQKPIDVFSGLLPFNNQRLSANNVPQFSVGDKIRLKVKKTVFDKISENYSRSVYTIVSKTTNSYKIKNPDGVELKRTIKPDEILLVNNVDTFTNLDDQEDEVRKELKHQKVVRKVRKEGVALNVNEHKREPRRSKLVAYQNIP